MSESKQTTNIDKSTDDNSFSGNVNSPIYDQDGVTAFAAKARNVGLKYFRQYYNTKYQLAISRYKIDSNNTNRLSLPDALVTDLDLVSPNKKTDSNNNGIFRISVFNFGVKKNNDNNEFVACNYNVDLKTYGPWTKGREANLPNQKNLSSQAIKIKDICWARIENIRNNQVGILRNIFFPSSRGTKKLKNDGLRKPIVACFYQLALDFFEKDLEFFSKDLSTLKGVVSAHCNYLNEMILFMFTEEKLLKMIDIDHVNDAQYILSMFYEIRKIIDSNYENEMINEKLLSFQKNIQDWLTEALAFVMQVFNGLEGFDGKRAAVVLGDSLINMSPDIDRYESIKKYQETSIGRFIIPILQENRRLTLPSPGPVKKKNNVENSNKKQSTIPVKKKTIFQKMPKNELLEAFFEVLNSDEKYEVKEFKDDHGENKEDSINLLIKKGKNSYSPIDLNFNSTHITVKNNLDYFSQKIDLASLFVSRVNKNGKMQTFFNLFGEQIPITQLRESFLGKCKKNRKSNKKNSSIAFPDLKDKAGLYSGLKNGFLYNGIVYGADSILICMFSCILSMKECIEKLKNLNNYIKQGKLGGELAIVEDGENLNDYLTTLFKIFQNIESSIQILFDLGLSISRSFIEFRRKNKDKRFKSVPSSCGINFNVNLNVNLNLKDNDHEIWHQNFMSCCSRSWKLLEEGGEKLNGLFKSILSKLESTPSDVIYKDLQMTKFRNYANEVSHELSKQKNIAALTKNDRKQRKCEKLMIELNNQKTEFYDLVNSPNFRFRTQSRLIYFDVKKALNFIKNYLNNKHFGQPGRKSILNMQEYSDYPSNVGRGTNVRRSKAIKLPQKSAGPTINNRIETKTLNPLSYLSNSDFKEIFNLLECIKAFLEGSVKLYKQFEDNKQPFSLDRYMSKVFNILAEVESHWGKIEKLNSKEASPPKIDLERLKKNNNNTSVKNYDSEIIIEKVNGDQLSGNKRDHDNTTTEGEGYTINDEEYDFHSLENTKNYKEFHPSAPPLDDLKLTEEKNSNLIYNKSNNSNLNYPKIEINDPKTDNRSGNLLLNDHELNDSKEETPITLKENNHSESKKILNGKQPLSSSPASQKTNAKALALLLQTVQFYMLLFVALIIGVMFIASIVNLFLHIITASIIVSIAGTVLLTFVFVCVAALLAMQKYKPQNNGNEIVSQKNFRLSNSLDLLEDSTKKAEQKVLISPSSALIL